MGNFFDLHRHTEYSLFDGFGNPKDLANIAKELGYKALGISDHGSISGLIKHYQACNDVGIKPVMGCEVYFLPDYNKKNEQSKRYYHLNLFVKNLQGYKNLCHIMTKANTEQFHYKPIVDFKLLEQYNDGLICTTACIASATSQAILNGHTATAGKLLDKFKSIFKNDLYVEIQPYKIDNKYTQQKVDYTLMHLARERKIKCILTSDSHFGRKEDFDTYCKMHEIGKTTLDVKNTYGERYMPSEYEITERFAKMYKKKFKNSMQVAEMFVDNMKEIYNKVEDSILDGLELELPKTANGKKELLRLTKQGLKDRGKYTKEYINRCKEELEVINYHGFADYFLIVRDYINWAKEQGIAVGKGRGSACNCLVAYAIGITGVDSIKYKLDFSRFMRKEKKALPDVDSDFETPRRQEVIDYVIKKYPNKAIQICSYGMYGVDNLINDLAGVCGLKTTKEVDYYEADENKKKVAEIKSFIKTFEHDGELDLQQLKKAEQTKEYNEQYDNIIKHFCKMYGKIRYLGKHAAGVAVVGTDISNYTCIIMRDRKTGALSSCFDKDDLEHINCTKFDMLGLSTMGELKELEQLTGHKVTEEEENDSKVLRNFRDEKTEGIFQFEKSTPKKILRTIHADCVEDIIAVNALNRPAPLQLKMHEQFAKNKMSGKIDTSTPYYRYTKETYGTMLYQEQTVEVAQKVGHLTAQQSFDMLKIMKKEENLHKPEYIPVIEQMRKDFYNGCKSEGMNKEATDSLWASMLIYGFNKGHSTAYALIPIDQMWYKVYYPTEFWFTKVKFAQNDAEVYKYSECAVKDGVVVMLPHVNYSALTSLRTYDGENVIQQGISTIKGVGEKAAEAIEQERKKGAFKNYDNFYDRCKGRAVTSRVIDILKEQGALEFDKKRYLSRVVKYNSSLMAR